jgi:two-component system NarL family sensor kinase
MRMTAAVPVSAIAPAPGDQDAGRPRERRPSRGMRRELLAFFVVSLIAVLAVAGATIVLSGWIARENQLDDAERTATRIADELVAQRLGRPGDLPAQREELDELLDGRLQDGSVIAFLVWSADGEIVYATVPSLEGQRGPISDELASALAGRPTSQVDDSPELPLPRRAGRPLLEVYVPMTVNGEQMAFETYFTSESIERAAALLRSRIVPLAVGALVVLELVQLPRVVSLVRRLRRQELERTQLVVSNLIASDRERREIAADVHDGPVQELAGVSYALSALRPSVPDEQQATVDRVVVAVRSAVASLRRLMVQIYPPDLSGPGLGVALEDLAVPLREQGLTVHVLEANKPGMSPAAAAVLYRTAREALANVSRHAQATTVWIRLEEARHDGLPAVRLTVADDGVGLTDPPGSSPAGWAPGSDLPAPSGVSAGEPGHLGLRLVRDRIVEAGGAITVNDRAGGGVLLDAVVPVQHGD